MTLREAGLWGPVIVVAGAIFTFSHLSHPPSPPGAPDWLLHGLEYGLLGLLLARALAGGLHGRLSRRRAALTMVLGVLYGATDEWHQSFIPGRQVEAGDLLADSAGTLLGLAAAAMALRLTPSGGKRTGKANP